MSRIDIVCPAWNRSAGIRPTIDSVLTQTVEDWRLFVVSDGSTDDTDEVVRGYTDPRVHLLRTEHHGHPGGPRNVGLAAANAPYIAYLDSDDQWLPEHLAVLLREFAAGARIVVTASIGIAEDGTEAYRSALSNSAWHPELQLIQGLYEPSRVGHVHGLAGEVGGWTSGTGGMEDWDLWLRFADHGEVFTPVTDRTVRMYLSSSSRRHNLPKAKHRITLGTVPTAAAAEAVQAEVRDEPCQKDLRVTLRKTVVGWYRDRAAELRTPPGVTAQDVLDDMDRYFDTETFSLYRELEAVEQDGRFAITVPVQCSSDQHAARLLPLLADYDRDLYDILRGVIDRHQ